MKKGLILEFLKIEKELGRIHENEDEFADQIPDNNYSGDPFISDEELNSVEKIDDSLELANQIPDSDVKNDDDIYSNMVPDVAQKITQPDFSNVEDETNGEEDEGESLDGDSRFATYDDLKKMQQTGNTDLGQPDEGLPEDDVSQQVTDPNMVPSQNPNMTPPADPTMGGAASPMGNPMMDPMMGMGMMGLPEPLDPSSIGKMYIIKKIYIRLLSINENLSLLSSSKYQELKDSVAEAIDHFQNFITNFDQFKDKLDEIIVLFQRFLVGVVNKIEYLLSSDENSVEEISNNDEFNNRE